MGRRRGGTNLPKESERPAGRVETKYGKQKGKEKHKRGKKKQRKKNRRKRKEKEKEKTPFS